MRTSRKLNEQDILDLLHEYQGEMRKLRVKQDFVKSKIDHLNQNLINLRLEKEEKAKPKPKVEKEKTLAPKAKRVFPLSAWDKLIIGKIQDEGKVLINQEILDGIIEKAKEQGLFEDMEKTKAKLNQCLIKLANRRGDLVKVKYKGRGFAYALPEWLEGRKLKKEYKR